MQQRIRAGIVGAAGYTGGELIRLLVHHPYVEIVFAHSKSHAGDAVYDVHTDLLGDTGLHFTNELTTDIDVIFLCMGHGDSKKFLEQHTLPSQIKIIDLSADFRSDAKWCYGLPELNKEQIKTSHAHISNPGCFATAIQLALLPLAKAGILQQDIHVSATTGSTGAGQSLSSSSHFSWRANNLSAYKAFEHQHLAEIQQSILELQQVFDKDIYFIPHRGSFTRGIHATLYTKCDLPQKEALTLYEEYYSSHPFVYISKNSLDLKQVINTNKCFLSIEKHGEQLMITSIIDNLLKGASGQAVQNMNLLFNMDETSGLKLKPSAF